LEEYVNKTLSIEFFPNIDGKSIYEMYDLVRFGKELEFSVSKIRNSVFKAAQSAPIVILSPRSRGFSSRETIINKYIN
jgi:hypothetical protein